MASSVTPKFLYGFLVGDARFTSTALDAASSYTEKGPHPGVATTTSTTALTLDTFGTQSASKSLTLRTQRAGMPNSQGASFLYRYGSEDWRGWDPPWVLSGFEWIERSTTANYWLDPHAVTLDDGTVVVAAMRQFRYIYVWIRNPTTLAWSSVQVYDAGSTLSFRMSPTVTVTPAGRILLYHMAPDDASSTSAQVRCQYSDDKGATWTTGNRSVTSGFDTTTATLKRQRVAYGASQAVLLLWYTYGGVDFLDQWASYDGGLTFSRIAQTTGKAYPDVAYRNGVFTVAWIQAGVGTTATYVGYAAQLSAASQDFTVASAVTMQSTSSPYDWATFGGGLFTDGDLALAYDDDGYLYVAWRYATTKDVAVNFSADNGLTWTSGTVTTLGFGDTSDYLNHISLTFALGQGLLISNNAANPTAATESLSCTYVGGYSSQPQPIGTGGPNSIIYVSPWTLTWLPFDPPESVGATWTKTLTGGATAVLGTAGLTTTAGAGDTIYYDATPSLSTTLGAIMFAEFDSTSGDGRIRLRISDATPIMYEVAVTWTYNSTIALRDMNAGSNVGSVTPSTYSAVQVLVTMVGASATAWYRIRGQTLWTQIATTSTLTSSATNPGDRIRFGLDSGTAGGVRWRAVAYTSGKNIYNRSWVTYLGRFYNSTPVYVDDGVKVAGVTGPTAHHDDFTIATRYDYPIARSTVSPADNSPRMPWASSSDASDQTLIWTLSSTENEVLQTQLFGLGIVAANWPTATLYGGTFGGGYTKIADISTKLGSSLKWTRSGSYVLVDTSGGNIASYISRDSLVGSYIYLDGKTRKIVGNTSGVWRASATSATVRIHITGLDGTEATSGTSGEIWSSQSAHIVPLTTAYQRYKLVIASASTAEGYHTARLLPGYVHVVASPHAYQHAMEVRVTNETAETRGGVRSIRNIQPRRRSFEIAWPDGAETSGAYSVLAPDYVVGWSGGNPVANIGDAPYDLTGLIGGLGGQPVMLLRRFDQPASSSDVVSIRNRDQLAYAHIVTETLRIDNVVGNPASTELMRVGTVRAEELT